MAVDFGGVKMQNPINTAAGTFGYGWQFQNFFDVSKLGAITTKGCAAEPWPGNPAPRMAEVRGGMINSVGLQNPGVRLLGCDGHLLVHGPAGSWYGRVHRRGFGLYRHGALASLEAPADPRVDDHSHIFAVKGSASGQALVWPCEFQNNTRFFVCRNGA